jgi:hypothetical protein
MMKSDGRRKAACALIAVALASTAAWRFTRDPLSDTLRHGCLRFQSLFLAGCVRYSYWEGLESPPYQKDQGKSFHEYVQGQIPPGREGTVHLDAKLAAALDKQWILYLEPRLGDLSMWYPANALRSWRDRSWVLPAAAEAHTQAQGDAIASANGIRKPYRTPPVLPCPWDNYRLSEENGYFKLACSAHGRPSKLD